jgi:hypothetical protein
MRSLYLSLWMLCFSALAAPGDLELRIQSAPNYSGQFAQSFQLKCRNKLCEVASSGFTQRKGKLKQELIQAQLAKVLEFGAKPLLRENTKPQTVVRKISFSSSAQKFEHQLGPVLDRSNLSVRLHRNYNKALDDLIRQALKELQ